MLESDGDTADEAGSGDDGLDEQHLGAKQLARRTMVIPIQESHAFAETWHEVVKSESVKHFVAGGVSGVVSRTLVAPIERIKIIFQCQSADIAYRGVFRSLLKIYREEGWLGFMKGNGVNVIRIVPYSAVQFMSYEHYKVLLLPRGSQELDARRRLAAGGLAGSTSCVFTYPLDLIRTRLTVQSASIGSPLKITPKGLSPASALWKKTATTREPGIWLTGLNIVRNEGGLRALYRGLGTTLAGVAPYVSLNFFFYETFRKFITTHPISSETHHQPPSTLGKLACGAAAGSLAQTFAYPLEVLRRRLMVMRMSKMASDMVYTSALDAFKVILKKEGIRGFYKGLWPNLLKVAPSIGSSFATYEAVNDFLST